MAVHQRRRRMDRLQDVNGTIFTAISLVHTGVHTGRLVQRPYDSDVVAGHTGGTRSGHRAWEHGKVQSEPHAIQRLNSRNRRVPIGILHAADAKTAPAMRDLPNRVWRTRAFERDAKWGGVGLLRGSCPIRDTSGKSAVRKRRIAARIPSSVQVATEMQQKPFRPLSMHSESLPTR
jgi:hypothetical protein